MKIKWKIVLASIGVIVLLTSTIVLFTKEEVNRLIYAESSEELKNYSNMGLQLFEKSYTGDWSIKEGELYKGDARINENFELIDEFTNGTKVLATIFQKDTRVATNVQDETGKRMIGSKASEEVIKRVLNNGEVYVGKADILGKSAHTYYVPIKDNSGAIIGMWFVGVYTDVVSEKINSAMFMILILAGVLLIIGIIISYLLGNTIAKGIRMIQEKLRQMEEGKFDFEFEEKLLVRKDEIGEIARSSGNMQDKIADIIKNIQIESEHVKNIAEQSSRSMEVVHGNIEDISATTEELSAGMEETSASTEEMNASTNEIETEIVNMKQRTLNENLLNALVRLKKLRIFPKQFYKLHPKQIFLH